MLSGRNTDVDPLGGLPINYGAHRLIAQPEVDRARDEVRQEMQRQQTADTLAYNNLWDINEHNFQGWEGAKKQRDLLKFAYEKQKSAWEKAVAAWEFEKNRADKNYTAWEEAVAAWEFERNRADKNYTAWEFQKNRADAAESQLAEKQAYVEKLETDVRESVHVAKLLLDDSTEQLKYLLALMNALEAAPVEVKASILQQAKRNCESDPEKLVDKFIAKEQGWYKQIAAAGTKGKIEMAVLEEVLGNNN
jgi:hypothetical protein